jgi:hypothetical protein
MEGSGGVFTQAEMVIRNCGGSYFGGRSIHYAIGDGFRGPI